MKRGLLFAGLAASLTACNLIFPPSGVPSVASINPADGEQDVALNTTVQATLNLPDESGPINVTTLTETTASLTSADGIAVDAQRTMSDDGSTIIVDPTTDLEPGTTYAFVVTSGLRTVNGTPVQGDSSTFTTATDGTTPPPPPGSLTPDRERVVFSAGGASSSDTRTLTLTNAGSEPVNVSGLSIGGEDAAQFSLADSSPFTLEPGASQELELTFTPTDLGPQLATLTVQSDDASGTLEVPLGGLGIEGQGGNLEPSLQWIFDTYGLGIDSGDDDPSSTPLVDSPTNGLIGDEVAVEVFEKAPGAADVSVQVLATFGVENDPVLEFGYYTAGAPSTERELFSVQQTPTLNAQRLAPEVDAAAPVGEDGLLTFDPGTSAFGVYSFWPTNRFFDQRTVYSESDLNTFSGAIPKQVRAYPLQEADGSTAYVLATEEFTQGFDYNDVVVILRGVVPGDGGGPLPPSGPPVTNLEVRNTLGEPYNDRLVLQQIRDTSGSLCNDLNPDSCIGLEQWADIEFRNTGVLELTNTGGNALQLSLSVADSNLFVLPDGENTLSLAPGESYDLEVQFAPKGLSSKGVYPSVLNIQAGNQTTTVELVGVFMTKPEARREVFLEGLVNDAFGYDIDLGTNGSGGISGSDPDSDLAGDEVRSAYWEAANPDQPVVATQIAAFHSCCRSGDPFELYAQGSGSAFARMVHDRVYGQSIYPSLPGESGPATLVADTSGPFEIRIAGYSTDPSKGKGNGNLGVRTWPLRDREGDLVANTYLAVQDFVEQGCGTSSMANCDYNDSMFIISNLEPVD